MADETILDQPPAATISGAEAVWIIQGGTDRRTTTGAIAALAAAGLTTLPTTEVLSGSTYAAATTDSLIIINKSVGSATTVVVPLSSLKSGIYYIKDGKGDADVNNITIDASGGQTFDTLTDIVINTPFGIAAIAPKPSGGWVILIFG